MVAPHQWQRMAAELVREDRPIRVRHEVGPLVFPRAVPSIPVSDFDLRIGPGPPLTVPPYSVVPARRCRSAAKPGRGCQIGPYIDGDSPLERDEMADAAAA